MSNDDETQHATRETVATSLGSTRDAPSPSQRSWQLGDAPLPSGHRIGRFMVIAPIGAGGMGEVYAAYDPDLDRRVALKMLRANASDLSATERLRREAQALAQLSHPNVVAVHDVGIHEDQVFIAMEYVEGVTLKTWLADHDAARPSDRETLLDILSQAGIGLKAAHEGGMVHRDFKPSNVLVGDDGRVRVVDFGLARGLGPREGTPEPDEKVSLGLSIDSDLTATGAIVGTPAYMAPEQYAAGDLDARADQFAFCVVAWQGLFGRRPFVADQALAMLDAIERQEHSIPAGALPITSSLKAALRKGLAFDVERRHSDLDPILQALQQRSGDRASSKRQPLAGLAAVVVVGGATLAAYQLGTEHADETCAGAPAAMAQTWDDDRRTQLGEALTSSTATYASSTWERLAPRLDAYASQWVDAHRDACEATAVRKDQSPLVLSQRMACLDRSRRELGAFVDLLQTAKDDAIEHALQTASELPSIEHCADLDRLAADGEAEPPKDPQTATAVAKLRDALAEAKALIDVGRYDDAIASLEAQQAAVQTVDYGPVRAEHEQLLGNAFHNAAQFDRAAPLYLSAYEIARGLDQRSMVLRLSASMVSTMLSKENVEHAELWGALVRADAPRLGSLEAERLHAFAEASIAVARSDYERALHFRRLALSVAERSGSETATNHALMRLAETYVLAGKYAQAEKAAQTVVANAETIWGPEHPATGRAYRSLGDARARTGDYDGAIEAGRRAVKIFTNAHGPQSPAVATATMSLAHAHTRRGDFAEALQAYEQVVANLALMPTRAATLGTAHTELAGVYRELGRLQEATAQLVSAKEIIEERLGPEHPRLAATLYELGNLRLDTDAPEQAGQAFTQAQQIWQATLGDDHPNVAAATVGLAYVMQDTGRPLEAIPLLESVYARWEVPYPDRLASLRSDISHSYELAGQSDRALRELQAARTLAQEHLGADARPTTLITLGIGSLQLRTGHLAEAIVELREGIDALVAASGRKNPVLADATADLCVAYQQQGDTDTALPYCEWTLEVLDAVELPASKVEPLLMTVLPILWVDPRKRASAHSTATEALRKLSANTSITERSDKPESSKSLQHWLRTHPTPQ